MSRLARWTVWMFLCGPAACSDSCYFLLCLPVVQLSWPLLLFPLSLHHYPSCCPSIVTFSLVLLLPSCLLCPLFVLCPFLCHHVIILVSFLFSPPCGGSVLPCSFPFPLLSRIFSSSFRCFKMLVHFSSRAVVGLEAAQWR